LVVPLLMIVFCSSVVFSTHVNAGLTMFKKLAASANATLFSMAWLISGIFTAIATQLKVHNLLPIATVFLVVSVLNLGLFYLFLNETPQAPIEWLYCRRLIFRFPKSTVIPAKAGIYLLMAYRYPCTQVPTLTFLDFRLRGNDGAFVKPKIHPRWVYSANSIINIRVVCE